MAAFRRSEPAELAATVNSRTALNTARQAFSAITHSLPGKALDHRQQQANSDEYSQAPHNPHVDT
jgi:hypothetical protein